GVFEPAPNWALSARPRRMLGGRQSIGCEVPRPRRSTATTGRSASSVPPPTARPARVAVEERAVPEVRTSGAAFVGGCGSRARIAPVRKLPRTAPEASIGVEYSAHSRTRPAGAGPRPSWSTVLPVQSRQLRSVLGTCAVGGGAGAGEVVGAPPTAGRSTATPG